MTCAAPAPFVIGKIDHTRAFLPEHLSPLPHTRVFHQLDGRARLRYNQLVASCYHEHFIFLERMLAELILPPLVVRYRGRPLAERLREFQAEERRHTGWFHRLHQATEPQLYRGNYYHFVQVPRFALRLLEACARRPERFPFCLWIAMIIEERTIPASVETMRDAERLEPHYVELHRRHARDEAGHVACDAEVLRDLWPKLSAAGRGLNRLLFVSLLREFFQLPKRAGWRVVQHLAAEQPAVRPLLPRIRRELLALRDDRDYLATLYSRRREPRTFALAGEFDELATLEEQLIGAPAGRA